MQDERSERENAALLNETLAFGPATSELIDLARQKSAASMRAIDHANGTVVRAARIEVNANGQHVFKNGDWRLNVCDTGLLAPRTKSRNFDAPTCGNREILMPHDLPVRIRRLVEEDRAYGEAVSAQYCDGGGSGGRRRCQRTNARMGKEVARSTAPVDGDWCERVS